MDVKSPGALQFHPFANWFPMMPAAERAAMGADQTANGTLEKIVMLGDEILDGRNRYCNIVELGLDDPGKDWRADLRFVAFEEVSNGLTPLKWVIAKNLHRRHLSETERAWIANKLGNASHGGARRGAGRGGNQDANWQLENQTDTDGDAEDGMTRAESAELLNVSERSVARAAKVEEQGVPALVDAVERGAIRLGKAEEIAELPREQQAALLAAMDPKVVDAALKARRAEKSKKAKLDRDAREQNLGKKILATGGKKFGIILADFEWKFEPFSFETGMEKSPENHYPTSDLIDIMQRDVAGIAAEDCIYFCWATAPMLIEAICVLEAHGFIVLERDRKTGFLMPNKEQARYVSELAWLKDRITTGHWGRGKHEILLIATRGKPVAPAKGTQLDSWLIDEAALLSKKGEHSAKPEIIAEWIEVLWPNTPKIELNRRGLPRDGWAAWGNQVEGDEARGIVVDENGFADAGHLPILINEIKETDPPSESNEGLDVQELLPDSELRTDGSASPLQRSSGASAAPPDSLQAKPARSRRAGKKSKAAPICVEIAGWPENGEPIGAIAVISKDSIRFYAADKEPFPVEIGMIEVPFDGDEMPEESDAANIAGPIFDELLRTVAERFIPTTIYRRGRTGPVPYGADA